jgi:hypothetical protein
MRFKFKPQTGILVAGLLAATYAEACYYQATGAVCVAAGTSVDDIYWNNTSGSPTHKVVTASSDWIINSGAGHYVSVSGSGSYQGYGNDGGTIPDYCTGPVHFTDASGNTASVSSWSYKSLDFGTAITPNSKGIYEGTVGSYGCP